ncbi:MAG: hypothetical protein J6V96_00895 [Aeriscardovia sp.]|nr:hypothetical protein [Aeriscardovia sp.]
MANAVKAAKSVYNTANAANSPGLSAANGAFSTDAGTASSAAGSASDASSLIGSAQIAAQNANAQLTDIQDESADLYDGSSSAASGSLVSQAKNFDIWAQTWIADADKGSENDMGYTEFLADINAALSDISSWEGEDSLKVENSGDAATVVANLKIMKSAVQTLQNLMGVLLYGLPGSPASFPGSDK